MKYKSFRLANPVPCPVLEMSSIQATRKREEDSPMQLSHGLHPRSSSVPSSGIWEWRTGTKCTFLLKDQPWLWFPAFHPLCFPVPYCSVQESGIHLWHQHRRRVWSETCTTLPRASRLRFSHKCFVPCSPTEVTQQAQAVTEVVAKGAPETLPREIKGTFPMKHSFIGNRAVDRFSCAMLVSSEAKGPVLMHQ